MMFIKLTPLYGKRPMYINPALIYSMNAVDASEATLAGRPAVKEHTAIYVAGADADGGWMVDQKELEMLRNAQ